MSQHAPQFAIRGLNKRFGSVSVLENVDLTVEGGEFVGLMGPNGAGKSTLIKILDGVHSASSGEILLDGRPVPHFRGRSDVGFIHQDLGLIDGLSIAANLRIGVEPLRRLGPILDHRAEHEAARRALELVGLDRATTTLVGDLAPGEQTLVAIARVMSRGASIVFVDESTSTLPPADAKRVIDALKQAVAAGATVIMVTHKLAEILDATQRVVVILDGRIAADAPTAGLDREALVSMLLQHEASKADRRGARSGAADDEPGEVVLELRDAYAGRAGPVNLQLRAGEVVGLTGLPGSGLHDVAFLAHGALRPTHGTVELARPDLRRAIVPPHRESQGGFDDRSVRLNLTMSALSTWVGGHRLLDVRRESADCARMIERLSVTPANQETDFGVLSGGNKQKVIFGRALLQDPQLYILCEPTRGVDVGTRSEIYDLIGEIAAAGAAVLIVSSDAEDLLAVCDRVGVVDGAVSELRPIDDLDDAQLEAML